MAEAARAQGLEYIAITDHSRRIGIGQARRGWLGKVDVLNTRPLDDLRAWLARPRG